MVGESRRKEDKEQRTPGKKIPALWKRSGSRLGRVAFDEQADSEPSAAAAQRDEGSAGKEPETEESPPESPRSPRVKVEGLPSVPSRATLLQREDTKQTWQALCPVCIAGIIHNAGAESFSSSGYLFVYHFGVIKCLRELGLHRNIYAVGSSGGACAASFLYLDADIDAIMDYICECVELARSTTFGFARVKQFVRGAVTRFAPPDVAERLEGNLEISLTALPWLRNARVREWADREAVLTSLLASSCVFPFPPVFVPSLGQWGIDGAYSDFQLLKAVFMGRKFLTMHSLGDAVSVCPFYTSRADIRPQRAVPPWWMMLPPAPQKLRELHLEGYRDTVRWLDQNGRIPYGVMVDPQTNGTEQSTPLWMTVLQETSAAPAAGYNSELRELLIGARAVALLALRCLLWLLIVLELLLHAICSAGVLGLSVVVPQLGLAESWHRLGEVSGTAASPWLLLKTVPAISPLLRLEKQPRLRAQLQDLSVLYRTCQYLL